MSAISKLAQTLCYVSVAAAVISLFLPQKRTRKIFGFVIGLFVLASLITCVRGLTVDLGAFQVREFAAPEYSTEEYEAAIKQKTAENLVSAVDELLRAEGIEARDIQLTLKISEQRRIYVQDAVIYISEDDFFRKREVEEIVYANLSKEPRVYVEKEEVEGDHRE